MSLRRDRPLPRAPVAAVERVPASAAPTPTWSSAAEASPAELSRSAPSLPPSCRLDLRRPPGVDPEQLFDRTSVRVLHPGTDKIERHSNRCLNRLSKRATVPTKVDHFEARRN